MVRILQIATIIPRKNPRLDFEFKFLLSKIIKNTMIATTETQMIIIRNFLMAKMP